MHTSTSPIVKHPCFSRAEFARENCLRGGLEEEKRVIFLDVCVCSTAIFVRDGSFFSEIESIFPYKKG